MPSITPIIQAIMTIRRHITLRILGTILLMVPIIHLHILQPIIQVMVTITVQIMAITIIILATITIVAIIPVIILSKFTAHIPIQQRHTMRYMVTTIPAQHIIQHHTRHHIHHRAEGEVGGGGRLILSDASTPNIVLEFWSLVSTYQSVFFDLR